MEIEYWWLLALPGFLRARLAGSAHRHQAAHNRIAGITDLVFQGA
jgi:hypothetical protein